MSKVKTEILDPVISDFLKYEATPQTRVAVAADTGTKAGKFVEYPLRGKKLLALTCQKLPMRTSKQQLPAKPWTR